MKYRSGRFNLEFSVLNRSYILRGKNNPVEKVKRLQKLSVDQCTV